MSGLSDTVSPPSQIATIWERARSEISGNMDGDRAESPRTITIGRDHAEDMENLCFVSALSPSLLDLNWQQQITCLQGASLI